MFGVTHVLARDGFSRMIISYSTMPVKTTSLYTRAFSGMKEIISDKPCINYSVNSFCTQACSTYFWTVEPTSSRLRQRVLPYVVYPGAVTTSVWPI